MENPVYLSDENSLKALVVSLLSPNYNKKQAGELLKKIFNSDLDYIKLLVEEYNDINILMDMSLSENVNESVFRDKITSYGNLIDAIPLPLIEYYTDHLPNNYKALFNILRYNTPSKIATLLSRYIIGQDQALQAFSIFMYLHLLRSGKIRLNKGEFNPNLLPKQLPLLIGPTGSGKTLFIEKFSELFNIPHIITDASSLTASGYVGTSIDDVFTALYLKYNEMEAISGSIIVFDEFDKLSLFYAGLPSHAHDVRGKAVQTEMLKVVEKSAEISFKVNYDRNAPVENITTNRVSFVFAGAFSGIEHIAEQRIRGGSMGFRAKSNGDDKVLINDQDLVAYGIIPELAGRITQIMQMNALRYDDMKNILLHSKCSPLREYNYFFKLHGRENPLMDEGNLEVIIREAISSNMGARGLYKAINKVLSDAMINVASESAENDVVLNADI